jgi:hypothetical protein
VQGKVRSIRSFAVIGAAQGIAEAFKFVLMSMCTDVDEIIAFLDKYFSSPR